MALRPSFHRAASSLEGRDFKQVLISCGEGGAKLVVVVVPHRRNTVGFHTRHSTAQHSME